MQLSGRMKVSLCVLLLFAMILIPLAGITQGHVWPVASGSVTHKKSSLVVDASNTQDGYIMAKYKESKKTLKTRVSQGKEALTYDQNGRGDYEVYPLQMGTGKYVVEVFEQVKGSKYAPKAKVSFQVKDMAPEAPFLAPNQYVWYTEDSPVVAKSFELCDGLSSDKEKFEAVRKHVVSSMVYNYPRAMSVKSGYLPDIDQVYKEGTGICFDISAVIACMLRVQDIPTKLMIGYADKNYHAWNEIMIDGEYVRIDATAEITGGKPKKYTTERVY